MPANIIATKELYSYGDIYDGYRGGICYQDFRNVLNHTSRGFATIYMESKVEGKLVILMYNFYALVAVYGLYSQYATLAGYRNIGIATKLSLWNLNI